jgi:hypothetical protein
MEDVMLLAPHQLPPPLPASGNDSNPQSDLTVTHSGEFECGLADVRCAGDLSSEANLGVDENRLAVNVVMALSKSRQQPRVEKSEP